VGGRVDDVDGGVGGCIVVMKVPVVVLGWRGDGGEVAAGGDGDGSAIPKYLVVIRK
jgi:hypothetical protein